MIGLTAVLFSILIFFQVVAFMFYPNNTEESKIVRQRTKDRSETEELIFKHSDKNLAKLFYPILRNQGETLENIKKVQNSKNYLILLLKYLVFNRTRPDVPRELKLGTDSTRTPSFPSGHSFQAFLIAKKFSEKYPNLSTQLFEIADLIGQSRIAAGWHYPSDHDASRKIVMYIK